MARAEAQGSWEFLRPEPERLRGRRRFGAVAGIRGMSMIASAGRQGPPKAGSASARAAGCGHLPRCPAATASDRDAARTVAVHPEQGWSLLCNGVVLFEDTGELLPDGQSIAARRSELLAAAAHRKAS